MGATLSRTIGAFAVRPTTAGQVSQVFLGIGVFSPAEEADDHDPATTTGRHVDWMYWTQVPLLTTSAERFVDFDIRSMRKIEEPDQRPFIVMSATVSNATLLGAVSSLLILP